VSCTLCIGLAVPTASLGNLDQTFIEPRPNQWGRGGTIVRCDCAGKIGVDAVMTTDVFGKGAQPGSWGRRARCQLAAVVVSSLVLTGCASGTDAVASGETFDFVSPGGQIRSEEHTSELQSRFDLVCRLLLEKKKHKNVWPL